MRLARAIVILLLVLGLARAGAASDGRITTDFYEVLTTPTGALDFFALTGERVIAGMPVFRASYFLAGQYQKLCGDVVAFPLVEESNDTVFVTSTQNLGILAATFKFTLLRHSPLVECRTVLEYRSYIDSVFFETIEAEFPADSAWVVMRDQKLVSAWRPATYVTDKRTTRAARFGSGPAMVTFPGEDNLLALRLKYEDEHWLLTYDLDRDLDHPFFRNWFNDLTGTSYDTFANTLRSPGTTEFCFRFVVGTSLPILKRERLPSGFQAALVMTEHADCEGPLTSKAIAYGSSEVDTPLPGRGILGNGLTWTKAVFRWHTYGGNFLNLGYYGLDRPDFKDVVDSLHARGVEIALHTPSARADTTASVAATLREMRDWYQTRTWIDHGMDYNPEAISRFGTEPESLLWYSLDTIRDRGIDYVWQSIDMSGLGVYDNNLFVPGNSGFYPPVLYTQPRLNHFGRARPLYLWPAWPVNDNAQRDQHLSPGGITRLIQQRGIDILHLYFAAQDTTVRRYQPSRAEWLIPHRHFPFITWETDPWIDGYFQFIAECQRQGRLWVPTLAQLSDFLLLSDSVEVQARSAHEFLLCNRAQRPVPGFTLSMLADGIRGIALDGQPVANQKIVDDDIMFWFDLPADTTLVLTFETEDYAFGDSALAPSQNPHLEYSNGIYHRVFADRGRIWYQQSVDDGTNWSQPETVAIGCSPSLVLLCDSIPTVGYDSSGLLRAKDRVGDALWSAIHLVTDTSRWQDATAGGLAASRLPDSLGGLVYVVYTARQRSAPQLAKASHSVRLAVFDTRRLLLDTLVWQATGGDSACSPAIATTRADILHLAWQQQGTANRVFYRTTEPVAPEQLRAGLPLVFSPTVELTQPGTPGGTCTNPALSALGDSVSCVWQGPNALSQPVEEIWRRSRWLSDTCSRWSPAANLSQSPDRRSLNPVTQNHACLWQEELTPDNFDIKGIVGSAPIQVWVSPEMSVWPHVTSRLTGFNYQRVRLGSLWADRAPLQSAWALKFRTLDLQPPQPLACYEVGCGESIPSPYCRYRDGFLHVSGHRLDTGAESLAYELRWLDPERSYELHLRFFAPDTDSLRQQVLLNDSLVAVVSVAPLSSDSLTIGLPPGAYAESSRVRLELVGQSNSIAALEGITVFESEPETTGTMSPGTQSSTAIAGPTPGLWLSSSNPSPGPVLIHYRLPRPDRVRLRLYDAGGRLVATLRDGIQPAGSFSYSLLPTHYSLSSGIFVCRLETSSGSTSHKLVFLDR
jgi:hypothetical protein